MTNTDKQKWTAGEVLAEYFTGPAVGLHSVGLSLSGPHRVAAKEFFRAREALGITGYATADEARAALAKAGVS